MSGPGPHPRKGASANAAGSSRGPDPRPIEGGAPFPAFDWEGWYASVGGRRPRPPEFAELFREMEQEQMPLASGEPALIREGLGDVKEATARVLEMAKRVGAHAAGVAAVSPEDVYAGRVVEEPFAVVVARTMDLDALKSAPSVRAAVEMGRVYRDVGRVCTRLAVELRAIGYRATVQHPVVDMSVLFLPLAERAGLGELGRHGSLISPHLGPMFRLGAVTTDAPLEETGRIDLGIARFCDACDACRTACPPLAIPRERSDPLGQNRYLVDTDKCFPYFAENHYCGLCLAVCPFNSEKFSRLFLEGRAPLPKKPAIAVAGAARRADVSRPLTAAAAAGNSRDEPWTH